MNHWKGWGMVINWRCSPLSLTTMNVKINFSCGSLPWKPDLIWLAWPIFTLRYEEDVRGTTIIWREINVGIIISITLLWWSSTTCTCSRSLFGKWYANFEDFAFWFYFLCAAGINALQFSSSLAGVYWGTVVLCCLSGAGRRKMSVYILLNENHSLF